MTNITTSSRSPEFPRDSAAADGSRPATDWLGIGYGLAIGALAGYHQFKLPPVLPILLRSHGIDETFGALSMSVYALVGLALSGLIGAWQSHRGIAPYLFAAFALLAAGNALGLAWPDDPWLFLASRTVEATGFAILAINCPLLCARHASPRHRMIAVAIGATWIPVGQLCAIGLGAAALGGGTGGGDSTGGGNWQALWWGGLAACALFAAATALLVRSGRVDLSPPHLAGSGGPAAIDAARRRAVWLTAGLFMLWSTQLIGYLTWLPEVLVSVFALAPDAAALAYAVPVATILVFNLAGGALLRHGVPVAPLLAVALVLQLAVWVALPWTGADWTGAVSLVLFGIGAGIAPTCLFSLPSTLFGARPPSKAFGTLMTGRSLGVLAGPLLLAQAFALTGDWTAASPMFALTTALAVAGALALHRSLGRLERRG